MRKHPQSIHDFICSQKRFTKMPVQKFPTDVWREQVRVYSFKNRVHYRTTRSGRCSACSTFLMTVHKAQSRKSLVDTFLTRATIDSNGTRSASSRRNFLSGGLYSKILKISESIDSKHFHVEWKRVTFSSINLLKYILKKRVRIADS